MAAVGLLLVGLLSGGCGQENSLQTDQNRAEQQVDDSVKQKIGNDVDAAQEEENSLAEWEASLQTGDLAELTAEAMRGMSVVRDGEPCFAISYEPRVYKNSFDCWMISVPYRSMAVVDTEAMYEYFQELAELELVPAENITKEEAGLVDASDTVFAAYDSRQTAGGGQARPDRGILFRFGKTDGSGRRYVEAAGGIWMAEEEAVRKLLEIDPYTCVLKVVSVVSVETVSEVSIAAGEERYVMQTAPGNFQFGSKSVTDETFYALYTELMSVFIEKELPSEALEELQEGSGDREPIMSIVYERNVADAPRIVQNYYVYDETYASVQVNGTEFFLVSREALAQLQEKIRDAF